MKQPLKIILMGFIASALLLGCDYFSGSDLKLRILFDETKQLQVGAKVDYAHCDQTVGRVKNVSLCENGKTAVDLIIFSQFKGLVRSGVMFVVDYPLFSNGPARILMDILSKDIDNPQIKSGTTLNGVTLVFYKMVVAADSMSPVANTVIEHSKILLNELEVFVKSDDFDRLLEALEKQAKIISGYTIEQKRRFERDIFPEIEKKIKNHYERLKTIYNQEEIKKLEKELNELKHSLDINTPAKQ
ncbi:MAG: hypothetical protein DRH21_07245 [Deltaproteobacteria bacterium]|nr:MAG: hypothetical protein DRH21_07245 [Deltaproteobacteria bacterium]